MTTAPDPAFAPPTGAVNPAGYFWYGTAALWTALPTNGAWAALPHDASGYGQKMFFGRDGYYWQAEPLPALTVTGRRLEADAPPLDAQTATNGFHADFGSFMLVGGNFPAAGCWEVAAAYAETSLTYVIWITP